MEDDLTLDGLLTELGVPAGDPPPAEDPPPATDPPAGDPPPAEDPPLATDPPEQQKAQQAFIHLRQQNSQMKNLLKGVAGVLGLSEADAADEAKLSEALQGKILTHQAEAQNVPPELLQRINQLEQREQAHLAQQRQQEMAIGFQRLQEAYGLTPEQVTTFATELITAGINPLTQPVDMVKEYRALHFEDILQTEREKAIAAEQERAAKAGTHSTTPGQKQGSSNDPPAKIKTTQDLDNFFKDALKT